MTRGTYIRTDYHRQLSSKLHKGRKLPPLTEEQHKKLSNSMKGNKNGIFNKGKIRTEETRRKISESHKGKKLSEEHKHKLSLSGKGKHHKPLSKETIEKMCLSRKGRKVTWGRKIGDAQLGEKNHQWRGGKSFKPYCYKFNNKRKRNVREFFNFMCICSGEHENDMLNKLNIHHTDHDKEQGCNGKPFNLVPMNNHHHAKEIHYEKEYADYINKTLREGFKWGIWNEQEYIEKVMYNE